MVKRKSYKPLLIIFAKVAIPLLILISFWLRAIILFDPDFGFHIRMGELITSRGVPATDPFSYTMPSFPSIDHEWLTDLIMANIYPRIGRVGLAAIFALIGFSALLIAAVNPIIRRVYRGRLGFLGRAAIPFLLGATVLLDYLGIRPQVESWFLLSILLWLILDKSIWERWRLFLPVLFAVWVNLHGSFAAGLFALFIVLFLRAVRLKRLEVMDALVAILCLLATFINPYGPRIWHEVWLSVSDTSLRWTIIEWKPALFTFNAPLLLLIPLSILLLLRSRQKFYLEEIGLYLIFLIQGLASTRHIPLWIMLSLPIFMLSTEYLYKGIEKIPHAIARSKTVYKYALLGCLIVFVLQSGISLNGARFLTEEAFYPRKAVLYLHANLPEGEIFSTYGWGGYLIWKLPEKKVFIDGRMPSWRWKENIAGESNYVMKDYIAISKGELPYQGVFEKYTIKTVLLPAPGRVGLMQYLDNKLDEFLSLRFGRKRHDFDLLRQIEKDGWTKIYEDNVAVIYTQNII